MMRLGLLRDVVGGDEDINDVPLRSCWERIRFVRQELTELSSATLPLLNVKSNEKNRSLKANFLNTLFGDLRSQLQVMKASFEYIENECMSHFTRFSQLDLFCSGYAENRQEQHSQCISTISWRGFNGWIKLPLLRHH